MPRKRAPPRFGKHISKPKGRNLALETQKILEEIRRTFTEQDMAGISGPDQLILRNIFNRINTGNFRRTDRINAEKILKKYKRKI